ncbi:MAG: radical SAM protein [Candidatus Omnitrophota bacterium]
MDQKLLNSHLYPYQMRVSYDKKISSYFVSYPWQGSLYLLNDTAKILFDSFRQGLTLSEAFEQIVSSGGRDDLLKSCYRYVTQMITSGALILSDKPWPVSSKPQDFEKDDSLSHPVRVQISLTNQCNLSCGHCYNYRPGKENQKLSIEQISAIIEKLDKSGVHIIELVGGEPVTHPQLLKLLALLEKRSFSVRLFTNGTQITPKLVEKITGKVSTVLIPIHGTGSYHDNFTGVAGSYTKALSAIRQFLAHHFSTVILTAITEKNKNFLIDIRKIADGLGAWFFSCPVFMGGRASVWDYDADKYRRLYRLALRYNNMNYCNTEAEESVLSDIWPCTAGRAFMYIDAAGDVYPCPLMTDKIFFCGNILNNDLAEIWKESKVLNSIRAVQYRKIQPCKECKQKKCFYWCLAHVYALTKTINTPPPYCEKVRYFNAKEKPLK